MDAHPAAVGGRTRQELRLRPQWRARAPPKNPGLFRMHKWMIEWCSVKLTAGNGFLELDNETTGMDIDVEAEYPLTEKTLYQFGLVMLRRSGHPEYEFADGFIDSSNIPMDECFRLQIANATGEDLPVPPYAR